jgi:cellulose synthase operon protein C
VLEGDVLRSQANDAAALVAYKTALAKTSPEIAAPRFHSLLLSMGKKADAEQFAKNWSREHAKDLAFATYMGDSALARKDFAGAEAAYRHVLELDPNHVASLNNVAWLLVKANKPGALPFAERANELQPNQPALMDTMASVLAYEKRLDEAVELQTRALALVPDSNVLRLSMARIYLQAQQRAKARECWSRSASSVRNSRTKLKSRVCWLAFDWLCAQRHRGAVLLSFVAVRPLCRAAWGIAVMGAGVTDSSLRADSSRLAHSTWLSILLPLRVSP